MKNSDINFKEIAARGGSQNNAFEELCSQLARKTCTDTVFERFHGAGGDGGVECITRLTDGSVTGWQAKFVFDVKNLIKQAKKSLQTALSVYKELNKFIICFPFDLTGKTKRLNKKGQPTKSQSEKLDEWIAEEHKNAKEAKRELIIEKWSQEKLLSLMLEYDVSGGMRRYFFDATILSPDWFKNHLNSAAKAAGPRYTPKLNVETKLWHWFSAFEAGDQWKENFDLKLDKCQRAAQKIQQQVDISRAGQSELPWPEIELQTGEDALVMCNEIFNQAHLLRTNPSDNGMDVFSKAINKVLSALHKLQAALVIDLDSKHGDKSSGSKSLRNYMSHDMVSSPDANLDAVRDAAAFQELMYWLNYPAGFLVFKKVFILSGDPGSGKTHGLCDMAFKRFEKDAYTCVLFGHQFRGQPAEWTRLIESLGLPTSIGKDTILDALDTAAQASGKPLIFCIDAVNETIPRNYWYDRFLPLAHEFEQRSFLKLCVSCRTTSLSACLPSSLPYPIVEHLGFLGIEEKACNAFFKHNDLEPPLVPILHPELSNPLYLKLVCETLKLKGFKRLPSGWVGLYPVIKEFLDEKEKKFARDEGISEGAKIVSGSLIAIAST